MCTALIYTKAGGGKTINSTAICKHGKTLLLNSDGSHIVLKHFERPNLATERIYSMEDFKKKYNAALESGKYENIIVDNLSDLFDMFIEELKERHKDVRQAYQVVYQALKKMVRLASFSKTNIIFTAWQDAKEYTDNDGNLKRMLQPKIPDKILDNICGLCNIVAYINTTEKDDKKIWYYKLEGTDTLYAKDQLHNRKSCMPENIFKGEDK